MTVERALEQPQPRARCGPILLIDDQPYILRSLGYVLTREGYQVETASNGEEGLMRVRQLQPPLVFLDVMLPLLDGYAVCEEIRRDPALAGTYVIMLSAKGQMIDRQRALLGGADEYMTKPFSPREVIRRVRAVLAAGTTSGSGPSSSPFQGTDP